jgi:hypothetical protein
MDDPFKVISPSTDVDVPVVDIAKLPESHA